ncbi:BgTH12-01891 [Blumeria graminis f. sp. triticale]|uniref:BgTH12-01891 n=1 Tax=Blumeria graminis f. sp. triticale TaxID=1689686 RepID=A0A9W4DKS6_BLUGR|nr:BgTH12-01891 [Blumeria graminis f. sp. triticale]
MAYEGEEKNDQFNVNQDAFFTDRQYHQTGQAQTSKNNTQGKTCYICGKEECRSWNHTNVERERYKAKFRTSLKEKLGSRFVDRNCFKKQHHQYIVDCEGDDESYVDSDEFEDAFKALELEIQGGNNNAREIDESDVFLTSFGEISCTATRSIMPEMAADTSNRSSIHALTTTKNIAPSSSEADPFAYTTSPLCYTSETFMGIMIDTGASKRSTAGYGQYNALQKLNNNVLNLNKLDKGLVNVQFGIGSTSSIGLIKVDSLIRRIEFHVFRADTPFLLCLADMDKLKTYFNNLTNTLVTPHGIVPVVRRFGHPFMLWDNSLSIYISESFNQCPCYLPNIELQQLHHRFVHPSIHRLHRILERSGHGDFNHRKSLEAITRFCKHCQKYGKLPGQFKFTLKEDVQFNYCIFADVMYIDGNPLLHIIDEGTRFQAGRWLKNMSAKSTWDLLCDCWINTYLGPPDIIPHDAGKNFASREFQQCAINVGSTTKSVPVEAHNSVGVVERYHGPLRRIYQIITAEIPGINKALALKMTFKAINDSVGPNGLVPILLVFGAYPRMVKEDATSPSVTQRTEALRKAMKELEQIRATRQVNDALNMRNGPSTTAIHALPLNSPVMVWREGNANQAGSWTVPYKLLDVNSETCTLELPSGPTKFRSTSVKPYLTETTKLVPDNDDFGITAMEQVTFSSENDPLAVDSLQSGRPKRQVGRPRRYATEVNAAIVSA